MDWYHLTLFIHISGVLLLFMAYAVEVVSMIGARAASTVESVRIWSSTEKPVDIAFPIAVVLLILSGLTMALLAWGWNRAWIDVGLVLLVGMAIMGGRINGGFNARIAQMANKLERGPIPPELAREINHPTYWRSVLTMGVLMLGVVFMMVTKPDWLGAIMTFLVALALGVIVSQTQLRRRPNPDAAS